MRFAQSPSLPVGLLLAVAVMAMASSEGAVQAFLVSADITVLLFPRDI